MRTTYCILFVFLEFLSCSPIVGAGDDSRDKAAATGSNNQETPAEVPSPVERPSPFVALLTGKERLFQSDFPEGRCAPLVAGKGGAIFDLGRTLALEASVRLKLNVRDFDHSSVFLDFAPRLKFERGFVGLGLSGWDLTLSHTRSVAALLQGGIDLDPTGRSQVLLEGRLPLRHIDEVDNNYQFWVGLKVNPFSQNDSSCVPLTCSAKGASCGSFPDGCGGNLRCGSCSGNAKCVSSGPNWVCCEPTTCAAQGASCGSIADGCGGQLACGGCVPPESCGGGGHPNVCGCTPTTCAEQGITCGTISNGCGEMLTCGPPCTVADCFHENQEIQFAPMGSSYNREGLIMHDNADFGDTAQREGWYWLNAWIRQNDLAQPWSDNPPRQLTFSDVLRKLEPNGDGVFVRAPGKDPFGRDTDGNLNHGMTRDQLVPLIAAMSVWGQRDELQRLWNALPEDILGKHDFQGSWYDPLTNETLYTSDPCNDIKNRDCTPKQDTKNCSRAGICGGVCPCSERGCASDCSTSNCKEICVPLLGCSTQCLPGVDLECQGKKIDCESLKATENLACKTQEGACSAAKEAQNLLYLAEAKACELQRTADVALCIAKKETGVLRFRGDPLPPMTYNLLMRALGRAGIVPITIFPTTLTAISPAGFAAGELYLKGAVDVIRHQATGYLPCDCKPEPCDPDERDCVDQDMNTIAMLWLARHTLRTL